MLTLTWSGKRSVHDDSRDSSVVYAIPGRGCGNEYGSGRCSYNLLISNTSECHCDILNNPYRLHDLLSSNLDMTCRGLRLQTYSQGVTGQPACLDMPTLLRNSMELPAHHVSHSRAEWRISASRRSTFVSSHISVSSYEQGFNHTRPPSLSPASARCLRPCPGSI